MQREVTKTIVVEDRTFTVRKYDVFTSVKISKIMLSKILPMFQSFLPIVTKVIQGVQDEGEEAAAETAVKDQVLGDLEKYLSMEGISRALDLITGEDLDFIMKHSLMVCFEPLATGNTQVMRMDGNFGVADLEHDPLIVMRLVCEAVLWGLGDFFTADRLRSIFAPLSNSLPLSQLT